MTFSSILTVSMLFAQNSVKDNSIDLNTIHQLVGNDADVRLLFINDKVVANDLKGGFLEDFCSELTGKVDVVAVFSKKIKKKVEKLFKGTVVISEEYGNYFDASYELSDGYTFLAIKENHFSGFLTTENRSDILTALGEHKVR